MWAIAFSKFNCGVYRFERFIGCGYKSVLLQHNIRPTVNKQFATFNRHQNRFV